MEPGVLIQPHGALAIVGASSLTIECISENVGELLGVVADELCHLPITALLDEPEAASFAARLREPRLATRNPHSVLLRRPNGTRMPVQVNVGRAAGGRLIVELEPTESMLEAPSFGAAAGPVERLAQAADRSALLATAAGDVQAVSGFNRVLIYRFDSESQCDVVAEAAAPGTARSYLGRHFSATHLPAQMRLQQARTPLRIIPDTRYVAARLIGAQPRGPRIPIDVSRAVLCDVGPEYRAYFTRMGSRAALTISILVRGRLWGLIACHHDAPRQLGYRTRALCELIGHMVAWQLDSRLEAANSHGSAVAIPTVSSPAEQRAEPEVDLSLAAGNAQAAALIKLHDDVAAAIPDRRAIIDVILAFLQLQTHAEGSILEAFSETETVYEAATGVLAPYAGQRVPRGAEESAGLGGASLAVVPIALSPTSTVALKVVSSRPNAFDDNDRQTLQLAASNLLTALRAAQKFAALAAAENEQRTYAQQLRALHAIASTTTSNRKDQIDAALELGLVQLDLDGAFLGVIDYAAQEFVIENSVSRGGDLVIAPGTRMPLGDTIIGRVTQIKGVCIVSDAAALEARPATDGLAAYIAVPLFIGDTHYGAIGFVSRHVRPQPFSEVNVEFVAVAGELIASAVERGLQRERLETSEARYRALTESIPEMVWVVDGANQFEYVNARWSNFTGLNLEQSRAWGLEKVYDAEHLAIADAKRAAIPPAEFDVEARLRRHDGEYRWHRVRSVPFGEAAGLAGKWLVSATDIEQRKSAEAVMADVHDAALAATQAKSRFLATMSHEIRTPMNAVIGMTELLLLTQLSDEQREYIEIVRDSGQSLLRVLNDILDYSKIEAGKLALESVHFDLCGQVDSVVELLRAQYHLKGVQLTTRIGPDVPAVVTGDPGRLRQILLNLAGNALKFTPEGGAVHIEVSATPAKDENPVPIRFTIEDTGIGIPAHIVDRLFQPFSQGDESTTRKYGGTGLGLSICAQLVALMNGTIGVRSTPGIGSAFWFSIPLRPAKSSPKAHDARKRSGTRPKPVVMRAEKILLVEDNEINTFLALKQLQRIGFIVSAVNNGQQAVEAVSREHFDLVFMDCHMPEMDGFAATREIRRLEAGSARHLPIVAMTADARTEDHQNCLRAGMDDYVSKPTSIDSLRAVLDRWLPTPDRRQNNRSAGARSGPAGTFAVAKLLELFGDDRNAVITLLTAAAGSIKADVARIENCAAAHDFGAVAEAAHRLKGTSASIRSTRLGEISAAVERAALTASAGAPIAPNLLRELRTAVDTLIADVEKHGKQLTTIG